MPTPHVSLMPTGPMRLRILTAITTAPTPTHLAKAQPSNDISVSLKPQNTHQHSLTKPFAQSLLTPAYHQCNTAPSRLLPICCYLSAVTYPLPLTFPADAMTASPTTCPGGPGASPSSSGLQGGVVNSKVRLILTLPFKQHHSWTLKLA